jgi:hypothetical protein
MWPFAAPIDVSAIDLLKLCLFGTTQFGLGLVFLTIGGQMVSASENALVNTLETPLGRDHPLLCLPTDAAAQHAVPPDQPSNLVDAVFGPIGFGTEFRERFRYQMLVNLDNVEDRAVGSSLFG